MSVLCRDENENILNSQDGLKATKLQGLKVSEMSTQSRFSTTSSFAPSTAELQMRYMEAKRVELKELRLRNERSCYEAIHHPQAAVKRTTKVTVPREFNLSRSSTPRRSRSVCSDQGSDMEIDSNAGDRWSTSLRGRSSSRLSRNRSSSLRRPQHDLTVPTGPLLYSSWRPRSISTPRTAAEAHAHPSAWSSSLRGQAPGSRSRSNSRDSSRGASAAPSPARSVRSVSVRSTRSTRSTRSRGPQLEAPAFQVSTPSRCASRRGTVAASPARSTSSCSDMSLASVGSRLSRRSSRTRGLSTADLEELEMEEGRRQLKEMTRHNEKCYRQAINFPDMRRGHHSLDLTVPTEFNLSVGNRTSRLPGSASEGEDSRGRADWTKSLRTSESPSRAAFQPKLTAPCGPLLRTSSRQRSSSVSSRDQESSAQRSISCYSMAPREQEAVKRHLRRAASVKAKPRACPDVVSEEDKHWIQAAGTAEEKAERARLAMSKRMEEAWNEEKQNLPFRAKTTDRGARSQSAQPLK
mmetsp:Transcript_84478/g.149507  ORF Transcript_84478/g.149507 Transcript_84478/m.149507 type:complete len:522 (+) Transcript_84478:114-1679(+)